MLNADLMPVRSASKPRVPSPQVDAVYITLREFGSLLHIRIIICKVFKARNGAFLHLFLLFWWGFFKPVYELTLLLDK